MVFGRLPIGYTIRLAIVRKVGRTYVDCEFYDRFGENPVRCPIPHPYPGRGRGILAGIEPDTLVLLANSTQEKWFIVGFVPDVVYYGDVDGVKDVNFDETSYPELEAGELVFKGPKGQGMELRKEGNLILDAGIGSKSADFEFVPSSQGLFVRVNNIYRFTEAGRSVEGVIKRDLNMVSSSANADSSDFLTGSSYDFLLSNIGRSSADEVQYRTTTLTKSVKRNPALIEKRDIVYEYADSFNVKDFKSEIKAMLSTNINDARNNIVDLQSDPLARGSRRTDTLNLTSQNYNHLIEKVQGTLVDIHGNILDLNRNVIPVPDLDAIDTSESSGAEGTGEAGLKKVYTYLRRSVKYHFEINSRKAEDLLATPTDTTNNKIVNSKWSVDVDGEGLTKINIPASSETGNIPVLARYVNSQGLNSPTNTQVGNQAIQDIKISQFGAKKIEGGEPTDNFAGQNIVDTTYRPQAMEDIPVTAGTAYHDLFNIANSIFTSGKLKSPDIANPLIAVGPLSSNISNKIFNEADVPPPNQVPNAGGKSIHMNLDGSLEMSVGADTIDRKSMVIDTAGGVIAHYGRDKNGRSIIQQTDGDIIIQVGGPGITGDNRFNQPADTQDRPGRVEIHLNRPGATPQKIIIDENGMNINIIGNGVISSTGDLIISAGGKLLLNGEIVEHYGSYNNDTRAVLGAEKRERRKGFAN